MHIAVDASSIRLAPVPATGVAFTSGVRERHTDEVADVPGLPEHYVEVEHLMSGIGQTYSGGAAGPPNTEPQALAYTTRVLVRYPADPKRFSGRVVVEPFNTSNGFDRDLIWQHTASLLEGNGDAWVGVTERVSAAKALTAADADRYSAINLPSNDLAWDILRHLAALIRNPEVDGLLPGLSVQHVYLAGYSQSACETATFASSFHDSTRAADGSPLFNGYFPAAHGASLTSLSSGRSVLPGLEQGVMRPLDVPVVDLETQTDVEGFSAQLSSGHVYVNTGSASVRRPDSDSPLDRFRLYEIAGAPHTAFAEGCDGPPSSFPTSAFLRAGLAILFAWVERGEHPPTAPRLDLAVLEVVSDARTDASGNALGGVRSPHLDLPLVTYLVHSSPGALCALAGQETPLPQQQLLERHGDVDSYLAKFTQRLDEVIDSGFLLAEDRATLLSEQAAKAREAFWQPAPPSAVRS